MSRTYDVAVMHDFFVDRLVYARSLGGLLRKVKAAAEGGGGGIHGVPQTELSGGNAVNLGHALAFLGLRTLVLTHSDPAHEALLRRTFEGLDVDLRVKPLPAGLTVAFEEGANVMLGDGRGAASFGPGLLDEKDWRALKSSRVVCSVNWAANLRGTQLLSALRRRLGKEATIFLDPADFRERASEFGELLRLVEEDGLVDWISMNEVEAVAAAGMLGLESRGLGLLCRAMARKLGVAVDLHSAERSYASQGAGVTAVRAVRTQPKRLTGAGDVWDAAAIYGRMKGMGDSERLRFANTAAVLYLESEAPVPPTLAAVRGRLG